MVHCIALLLGRGIALEVVLPNKADLIVAIFSIFHQYVNGSMNEFVVDRLQSVLVTHNIHVLHRAEAFAKPVLQKAAWESA